ncbi:class I SAM-dependent RNA methyltransferase [Pelagibius sp. Alg239-R121]|uniref:class I SAM-dependent RNA methyltransferase n=1 Tax=Pelagibius sp. Alg239-R121 TaxID=2993448 RepID=UPI0024A6C43F|nr:TRAM domain-containing protein [Pelagibius sp. Alg239-R121]
MRRKTRRGGGRQMELTVETLGARGDGVTQLDGRPVFLPMTLPGDRVIARIQGERGGGLKAEVVELLETGSGRVDPPCPHFGPCGGCTVQHLDPAPYGEWKRDLVVQGLERRGFSADIVAPLIQTAPGSRRRMSLRALKQGKKLRLGFNGRESRFIVDLETCLLVTPGLRALIAPLRAALSAALAEREQADIVVTETQTGLDLLISSAANLDLQARENWAAFAEAQDLARLSWQHPDEESEPLSVRRGPQVSFGGIAVEPVPGGFLQPSVEGERTLTDLVMSFVPKAAETIADLFSGAGTFTFPLAARARVHAVEGDERSVAALWSAARRADLANRITVEQRDLMRQPVGADELEGGDCVVFDPPRAGARDQALELGDSSIATVIAVSCNPNTFGRDARILVDSGYELTEVTPVDQFPWSGHVELVACFKRN